MLIEDGCDSRSHMTFDSMKNGVVFQQCVNCTNEKIWGSGRLANDCLKTDLVEGLCIVVTQILCMALFKIVCTAVKSENLTIVAVVLHF